MNVNYYGLLCALPIKRDTQNHTVLTFVFHSLALFNTRVHHFTLVTYCICFIACCFATSGCYFFWSGANVFDKVQPLGTCCWRTCIFQPPIFIPIPTPAHPFHYIHVHTITIHFGNYTIQRFAHAHSHLFPNSISICRTFGVFSDAAVIRIPFDLFILQVTENNAIIMFRFQS